MKKLWYAGFAAVLLLSSVSVALADPFSTPGAPTDPQPFSVTCDPYTSPFTDGGTYAPSGSDCIYTLPQTGNIKVVGIYKGTVGNSVPVQRGFAIGNPASTLEDTGYDFSSAQPGDTYFAAAYSAGDINSVIAADSYLQNSSTGATTTDLTTLSWVWAAPPPPPPPAQSPLTITADNKTVELGSALPPFTATLSGFVAPDTATSNDVTGSASCTTTATATSPVGTYPITCTVGSLVSATHYTFSSFVAGTLSIVDTTKPVVTISSPLAGKTFFKNDTVAATASATDLSPITLVYKFNGTVVAAGSNLLLSSAPAGTSTASLVVAATDASGNTGYATSTFTVVPPDLNAPSIVITNPLKNGVYAKTDSVVPTATVTDQSPIVSTTYWFGTKKIDPTQPLPLSTAATPSIQSVSVSATDSHGNTATSTVKFFVVKNTNSCLVDIISVLVLITQDKTLPDKPTITNLIADCSALLKGKHHY